MKTPAQLRAHRNWYRRNAAAVIMQQRGRRCGISMTLAQCRRELEKRSARA